MGRKYDTYAYRKEHYPNWFQKNREAVKRYDVKHPFTTSELLKCIKRKKIRDAIKALFNQNDPGNSLYKEALQERLDNL